MSDIAIHYIEIKNDPAGKPAEILIARSSDPRPEVIRLRRAGNRANDIAGVGRRAEIDPQTGDWLEIVDRIAGKRPL